jgi:glucose-6-phosphate 1-dehydrogenase
MIKTNRVPTIIYIFGGSGDLTQRKLIPALYNLYIDNYLPDQFKIIGVGRHDLTLPEYKAFLKKGAQEHSRRKADEKTGWSKFVQHVDYAQYDLTNGKSYTAMKAVIKKAEEEWDGKAQVIFYMSVAPQLAPVIAQKLFDSKLCEDSGRSRVVFEKPFGHDLASATELNHLLCRMFKEEQIYRIDHYLGKETVQNILALRFANILFEPIWNNHYIDHVQITAAESIGVGSRGSYYEGSGALRDMVQNHMLQLLCMIAMEPPISFDADEIRNKKVDVLNGIRTIKKEDVHLYAVRGQYSPGWVRAKKVKGYREEQGVAPSSSVETFAAAKFYVDNWRWKDVPFYLRTGKYLTDKETLITIHFKEAPDFSFPSESEETWRANKITISIQPRWTSVYGFNRRCPART